MGHEGSGMRYLALRELDHDLDVVVTLLERVLPPVERHRAGHESAEPILVRGAERLHRLLEMATVCVDRPEHDVVLQDELVVERPDVDAQVARRGHTGEADDRAWRG